MSRCFPFPPPGYEKKPRTDLEDLLTKEKHREKKHKKEKRDKENQGKKRKDREKDSDQCKDKHREKKDKKEKHGDEHKKKHKYRDKDKKRILNERKDEKHKEGQNERKVVEHSFKAKSSKESELVQELGRRLRDEESGTDNELGEISGKIQTFECMARDSAEKERSTDDKIVQNISIPEQSCMGMASATEERHMQNETLQNSICEETRRVNGTAIPMCMDANKKIKRKEKTKEQRSTDNKMVQGITIPEQRRMGMASVMGNDSTENETLQTSVCEEKRRVNGMGAPMHENANKKIEGREKTKEWEFDNKWGDVHKDRVREKIHKGKNKDREKEREKEREKMRENGEQNKLRYVQKKEQVEPSQVNSFSPKDNQKTACADGSRKRREINGFLHENEMWYDKLSRPAPSSQLLLENGSKLVQGHVGSSCASDRHEAINMVKQDRILHKVNKINGVITVQPPAAVLALPEYTQATRKPPHPDGKYLSQILHVPKMEEWPESDDQDWLFNKDNIQQKPKAKVEVDESVRVWEGALQIECADILALPYVIPY